MAIFYKYYVKHVIRSEREKKLYAARRKSKLKSKFVEVNNEK